MTRAKPTAIRDIVLCPDLFLLCLFNAPPQPAQRAISCDTRHRSVPSLTQLPLLRLRLKIHCHARRVFPRFVLRPIVVRNHRPVLLASAPCQGIVLALCAY